MRRTYEYGGCGYDVCDLESRWKMIILQLVTCSRSRLKNSRLVYQTVGGYFMIILTNCVSDAEGLTAYRFGSTHDMIIVINNRKHNIYLLTNG